MTLFVADCGRSTSHIWNDHTKTYHEIPHQDFLNLNIPGFSYGDSLVIEEVHLRPREKNSLAQPFSFFDLLELHALATHQGVTIKLFPNEVTPKARALAGFTEKNDQIDVESIANYLSVFDWAYDQLKLFNPISTKDHQERHQFIWHDRNELSHDVNCARNIGYGFDDKLGGADAVTNWINAHKHVLYERLGPELAAAVGILKYARKDGYKKLDKPSRLYSIVVTLLRPDGQLRLRSDINQLPHWKHAKQYYFCLTPYHRRGGVIASNYKHHMRPSISGFTGKTTALTAAEWNTLSAARAYADKQLQIVWNTVRQLLVEEYY
jgi:hypothetical protein